MCSGRFHWVAASNARVAPPLPARLSRRVTENYLSGVGCRVPYGSLTHDDLAGSEVADAEDSSRIVVSMSSTKHLAPRGANLCSNFVRPGCHRRSRCRLRRLRLLHIGVTAGLDFEEARFWVYGAEDERLAAETGSDGGGGWVDAHRRVKRCC